MLFVGQFLVNVTLEPLRIRYRSLLSFHLSFNTMVGCRLFAKLIGPRQFSTAFLAPARVRRHARLTAHSARRLQAL